jgi:deoxyribodipyrimidine photo-lyase
MKINIFWFRRDLRLDDNTALNKALNGNLPVLPVFIFDPGIIDELPEDDARITFIHEKLSGIDIELKKFGSSLLVFTSDPLVIWNKLVKSYDIEAVFINKDYEPYAIARDLKIEKLLQTNGIPLLRYKDQVIFEEKEILTNELKPYTMFTPYRNKWVVRFREDIQGIMSDEGNTKPNYHKCDIPFPSLQEVGFRKSKLVVRPYDLSVISTYTKFRDFPSADRTSYLSPHLRFGTVSIRKIVNTAFKENMTFLNELIWREFFMQILFNFPKVVTENFRSKFDNVPWRNDEEQFERWCNGRTGYPIVDAGMSQLNNSGYMHNRVRMITAGFLVKHLLIDWRWGEAYFAMKLLDYELSSNNGNWQWAAGTGCDAAQYFRVFNPNTQQQKFDRNKEYIKNWVPDIDTTDYPQPMVDHDFARKRVLEAYRTGLERASYDL